MQLYINTKDPIERQFVDQAISSRISQVEQDVSKQVLRVAVSDLQQVLTGGTVQILGQHVELLGLRNARTIVQATIASLPPASPLRVAAGGVQRLQRRPRPGSACRFCTWPYWRWCSAGWPPSRCAGSPPADADR